MVSCCPPPLFKTKLILPPTLRHRILTLEALFLEKERLGEKALFALLSPAWFLALRQPGKRKEGHKRAFINLPPSVYASPIQGERQGVGMLPWKWGTQPKPIT